MKAEIEYQLPNNKLVDIAMHRGGELLFYEVAVSPPLEKELENYVRDLATNIQPNNLIAVTTSSKARMQLEKLIQQDSRLQTMKDKIEVRLAGEFLK